MRTFPSRRARGAGKHSEIQDGSQRMVGEITGVSPEPPTFCTRSPLSAPPPGRAWDPPKIHRAPSSSWLFSS